MSSVYTDRQKRFIHVFMQHTQPLLKSFLRMDANVSEPSFSMTQALNESADGVNVLSSAVAIAGIAGAAPSLGTSLVGAAACIVLLQTMNGGYQFVKRHVDNQDSPFFPDETKLDELHLTLTILLRHVAFLAAVRYRHFIDEIMDEHSVGTFAGYVADRAIKKLANELTKKTVLATSLNAETFLNYLMEKATLSITHPATTVSLKEEYNEFSQCSPSHAIAYAKLACSRAGLAVYDNPTLGEYTLYVSPPNNMFTGYRTATLQQQYGFATVSQTELGSETAAVNRKTLQLLSPEAMQEALDKNKKHLSHYYQVSRQQVSDYLIEVRSSINANQPVKSLNQYLSESVNGNLIASCDNKLLCGLDLSHGDFSEVWFIGVDLSDCNLQDTIWKQAHLNGARFERNELTRVNFQRAHLEKSIWHQVSFTGDFSHAMLNGSKLTDCTIEPGFNQFGSDWELVEMENINIGDAMKLLNLRFDEQLLRTKEEQARINDTIQDMTVKYQECLQKTFENKDSIAKETGELTTIQKNLRELGDRQASHFIHLEANLLDLKTQFNRLKTAETNNTDNRDKKIERLSRRLDKLEAESSPLRNQTVFSFFQLKPHKNNKNVAKKAYPDNFTSLEHNHGY